MADNNNPQDTKPDEEPRKPKFVQRFGIRPRRCPGCPK